MLYPLSYGGSGGTEVISRPSRPRAAPCCAVSLRCVSASLRSRVLVVDDSDVIRTLITVNLELEGFEVVQAVDGQDALDKVLDVRPDVITIDVKMPRLDGFDTVERLRADPRTQRPEDRDGDGLRPGGRPPAR